jgi:GDP-D-mannose 3', 5'-epimerase
MVAAIAGKSVRIRHNRSMPQGVRTCNSDNALLRHVLGWVPQVSLAVGLARTYAWIAQQVAGRRPRIDDRPVARAPVTRPLRQPMITAA